MIVVGAEVNQFLEPVCMSERAGGMTTVWRQVFWQLPSAKCPGRVALAVTHPFAVFFEADREQCSLPIETEITSIRRIAITATQKS
jgi:hypothetical protein